MPRGLPPLDLGGAADREAAFRSASALFLRRCVSELIPLRPDILKLEMGRTAVTPTHRAFQWVDRWLVGLERFGDRIEKTPLPCARITDSNGTVAMDAE